MKLTTLALTIFLCAPIFAQEVQNNAYIKSIIDQVNAEPAPWDNYSGLNSKQKDLLEKNRKKKIESEVGLLHPNNVIVEGELFDYVQLIFNKIVQANPSLNQNAKMVLFRSYDFNAFTMGDNLIFINLGLIHDLRNEDEIALVIGHELAHNTLKHSEKSMIDAVLFITDEELNKRIEDAAKQEYGNVSELNRILVPRVFETKEKSRKHELQADSLGAVYIKMAGFDLEASLRMFNTMSDHNEGICEALDYSILTALCAETHKRKEKHYEREGSLGTFEEEDTYEPYLRSHPYSEDRLYQLAKLNKINLSSGMVKVKDSEKHQEIVRTVRKTIISQAVANRNYSKAFYYAYLYKAQNSEDSWIDNQLACLYSTLGFLKERRTSGKYLTLQNPKQAEPFDRLCFFLYAVSPAECVEISGSFQKNKVEPETAEQALVELINLTKAEEFEQVKMVWAKWKNEINNSSYRFVMNQLEEYLRINKKVKLNQ